MTLNALISLISVWFAFASHTGIEYTDMKNPGQWKEVKNNNGVQSFFRWVTKEDGTSFRERKGEMYIACSLPEAVRIISRPEFTPQWMSGIDECKTLGNPGNTVWYTYTLFSIPWPFSKRDLVSLNQMSSDPLQGITVIDVICKEKYVPLKPNITRLTDYKAQWKITKLDDNSVHLSFSAASSAPPAFPRYIQDPVIERMFHNNLVRLKELLQDSGV